MTGFTDGAGAVRYQDAIELAQTSGERIVAPTFGMDVKPTSMKWSDISRGPTVEQVKTHIEKLSALARSHKR